MQNQVAPKKKGILHNVFLRLPLPEREHLRVKKTLLIVHHSRTGGSLQMAQAAQRAAAAAEDGVQVRFMQASEAAPADLLGADGYLFACPENLAAIAGLMKDFFDRCYYPVLDRIQGRPYAALICAGSDGSNAARQLERIATGWRLKRVAPTLIVCTHAQTARADPGAQDDRDRRTASVRRPWRGAGCRPGAWRVLKKKPKLVQFGRGEQSHRPRACKP